METKWSTVPHENCGCAMNENEWQLYRNKKACAAIRLIMSEFELNSELKDDLANILQEMKAEQKKLKVVG